MTVNAYGTVRHRQFTGVQGGHLKWLPFPGADPHSDNPETHQIMILGSLQSEIVPSENPDCKTCTQEVQECLMLADRVLVTDRSSGRTTATIAPLANFLHAGGRMSALAAAPHHTAMLVISGSQQGLVSCVPFELPQAAGSAVEEIQVHGGVVQTDEGVIATSGIALHTAPVTAVDICPVTSLVLTASADGSLFVTPAETLARGGSEGTTLARAGAWTSVRDAKWTSPHACVSAGTAGGLQLWDDRKGSGPVSSSPQSWGFMGHGAGDSGATISSIAMHPNAPHICVTGSTQATLALWDLRMATRPVTHALSLALTAPQNDSNHGGAQGGSAQGRGVAVYGTVWQAMFDRARASSADMPVLACTESGHLLEASFREGSGTLSARVLAHEPSALVTMDVDPVHGSSVLAGTDQECVLQVDRPLV